MAGHEMTRAERWRLHSAARDLHTEFRGIFGQETIESLLLGSYAELAATATVTNWLAASAHAGSPPAEAAGSGLRSREHQAHSSSYREQPSSARAGRKNN
jgi:hypothetical protein